MQINPSSSSSDRPFWLGFFIGGLLGAILIFVLGTKQGKKIAEDILDKTESTSDELERKINTLRNHGQTFLHETEKMKKEITEKVSDKKNAVSDTILSRMDAGLWELETIQKKGVTLTQDVRKKFFRKNGKSLS